MLGRKVWEMAVVQVAKTGGGEVWQAIVLFGRGGRFGGFIDVSRGGGEQRMSGVVDRQHWGGLGCNQPIKQKLASVLCCESSVRRCCWIGG